MANPKVTWYDDTNTQLVSQWLIPTTDAGSVSQQKSFLIWNNRGEVTAVADMYNCVITTKDSAGGNTGELVMNKWIEVKVDTMNEANFTPIGGVTTKAIKAGGSAPAATISGAINDGNIATVATQANFAKVTLQANVPPNATAGNYDFLTRVTYQHN